MFDSDIDIKDDILQMVLSGSSGSRLKEIIATIQREQDDIIRTGEEEPAERVEAAFRWLEAHVGEIAYDGEGLTPDKLKLQDVYKRQDKR